MKRHNRYGLLIVMITLLCGLVACGATPPTPAASNPAAPGQAEATNSQISGKLVLYSGRSEPLIQPVIVAFSALYPEVRVLLKSGGNSELANALIEERNNSQADVFISTELFTIQMLAQQGILQPYRPVEAHQLRPGWMGLDNLWTPLTQRARVILYNTELVAPGEAPTSIFELSDPRWKGQVAMAGSTNGSMQAHIATMQQLLGDEQTLDWLEGLVENQATFFGGHTDVRKAVGAGEFKLGLVNHYYYHLQKAEGSPVGVIYPDQGPGQIGLLTNATAVAIIQGASNLAAAQAFIDFLLSIEGQQLFASLNYEYPLRVGVVLHPDVQPLGELRLADVDIIQATRNLPGAFELIEQAGIP